MLIYLKYARAYALFKKAFCYAQRGQICLKLCGPNGPKPNIEVYFHIHIRALTVIIFPSYDSHDQFALKS